MKTVRQGEGRERKGIPFSGTSRMTTFWGGQKRWAQRVLTKEEKQVRGREVVVRHGKGNRGLPLARHGAPQDTVALANSSRIGEQRITGLRDMNKVLTMAPAEIDPSPLWRRIWGSAFRSQVRPDWVFM
jgi:hypothetical protein